MEYVRLGNTGIRVSRLCLGTMTYGSPRWREWVLDETASRPFIERALEAGINFFDTADMYSDGESERVLGRALGDMARREEVVIATKAFNPTGPSVNERGLSRKHIRHAVDASLERLGTDYIDLYQIHRWDYRTPVEEMLEALHDLVKAGKVLYLGASSMYAWQLAKSLFTADRHGWHRFVAMQPMYNLVYREEEREMLPLCRDQGLAVIPWSPLARGFLAGKSPGSEAGETARARSDEIARWLRIGESEADLAVRERLRVVAERHGVSAPRIALAWLLHKPAVTAPIVGASRMEQLEDALGALDVRLSDEDMEELERDYVPHPVVGHR